MRHHVEMGDPVIGRSNRHGIVAFLALLNLLACGEKLDSRSVAGEYVANHNFGRDVIVVRDDGTYVHTFVASNGSRQKESGRWELDRDPQGDMISFSGFTPSWDGRTRIPGIWPARMETSFGRIRLRVNDDLDLYYQRR